jgi:hypothetical protein
MTAQQPQHGSTLPPNWSLSGSQSTVPVGSLRPILLLPCIQQQLLCCIAQHLLQLLTRLGPKARQLLR